MACRLQRLGQPGLDVFDIDEAQLAEQAGGDHGAGLPDHRIAGIGVGDGEEPAGAAPGFDQILGLLDRHRQRLVADDVEAGFHEGFRRAVMNIVRGDDGDDVDPVGTVALAFHHRLPGLVAAVRGEVRLAAALARPFGIGGERAGDELVAIVDPGGEAMHWADEGARAAANHAEAQASPDFAGFSHVFFPQSRLGMMPCGHAWGKRSSFAFRRLGSNSEHCPFLHVILREGGGSTPCLLREEDVDGTGCPARLRVT